MIIFQTQPNRLYLKVVSHILEHTNITSENFQHGFLLKNHLEVRNINNTIGAIHINQKHNRDVDFLYGVFSSTHLNLKDEDFVFTLLTDPLYLPYDLYAFFSIQFDYGSNPNIPYKDPSSVLVRQNTRYSLEQWIDKIINDEQFIYKNKYLKYSLIKEATHGFENYNYFNYIGKYSHLNHLFHTLNQKFNFNIPFINQEEQREHAFVGERYRLDDLAKKFKKQVKFYKNLDNIYNYSEFK